MPSINQKSKRRKSRNKIVVSVEDWQMQPFINDAQSYVNNRPEYPAQMSNDICNNTFLISDGQLKSAITKLRANIELQGFPRFALSVPDINTINKLSQESCTCPSGINWTQKKAARDLCETFFLKWCQLAGDVEITRKAFEKVIHVKQSVIKVEYKKRNKPKYQ